MKELVEEMEGAGLACYETEIGGDGALFMEDVVDEEDATQGAHAQAGPTFRRRWRKRKLQEEA